MNRPRSRDIPVVVGLITTLIILVVLILQVIIHR